MWHLVQKNIGVAFFSLELPSSQIFGRLWALYSERSPNEWRLAKISEEEQFLFYQKIEQLPLFIEDKSSLSLDEFRAEATYLVKEKGVQLMIIDYLQLMSGFKGIRYANREAEVSAISREIKAIAKDLEVPIIGLAQLSRAVETRGGSKRPQLSDLRESGAIEQDADVVGFCYRPEYYNIVEAEDGSSLQGIGEVIIAKHREGALDSVKCYFKGTCMKWANYDDWDDSYENASIGNFFRQKNEEMGQRNIDDVFNDF